MLNIKKYLIKNGYDIIPKDDDYIISKNKNVQYIKKNKFEKLMFVKLIDLLDELLYDEEE